MEGKGRSPTNSSALAASSLQLLMWEAYRVMQEKNKTIDINEPAHKRAREERKLILGLKRMAHDLSKLEKSPEPAHKRAREERKLILGLKRMTHDLSNLVRSPQLHNGEIYNQGEEVSPHKLARLTRKNLLRSKRRMPSHFIDKANPVAELSPHKHAQLRTMDVLRSKQKMPHPFIDERTSVVCESPHKQASRKLEENLIVGEPLQARRIRKEILNAKRCGRHERGQQCQRKCATRIPQCGLANKAARRRQHRREKKGQMTEEQLILARARNRQYQRNHRARLTEEQLAALRERCRRRYIASTRKLRPSYIQQQRNPEAQIPDVHVSEVFNVAEYEQMIYQKRSLYRGSVSNIQRAAEKHTNSLDTEPIECFVEVPILEADQSHISNCTKRSTVMNNLLLPMPMGDVREVPIIEVRSIYELEDMLCRSGYNSTIFSFGTSQ